MTAEVNFKTHTMDITLTADGVTTAKLSGVAFYSASYTDTIGGLYVRAAKSNATTSIDNFGVYTMSAPQYAMNIAAVTAGGSTIDGAQITVKNSAGETISPETSGENSSKYMLVEGDYTISVTASGYAPKEQVLELTPALSSKDITVTMTAN